MRGEKDNTVTYDARVQGSPPRARGKELRHRKRCGAGGITPACAGKSLDFGCIVSGKRDHPRVRGEKVLFRRGLRSALGSPPRARGKDIELVHPDVVVRITPACAGKRYGKRGRLKIYQDHPRVRGEKSFFRVEVSQLWGSPPRARGKASISRISHSLLRITPACAGKRADAP